MKVLHVYKTYFPDSYGGIEETIRNLSKGVKQLGVTAEVFTMSENVRPEPFIHEDIRVHQARTSLQISSTPFSVEAFSKFRKLASAFDIIHYHYPYPFADMLKFTSFVDKPSIVTYHSDIVKQKILKYAYAPLEQMFLSAADMIVCTSKPYAETSVNLKKYKDKVKVVNLGLPDMSKKQPSEECFAQWQYLSEKPFFLFLGALRNYKGINTLLNAAGATNSTIVIAGGGSELPKFQKEAKKQKLDNVVFTGRITDDEKLTLLSMCYGLILPSNYRSEAFGLVLLEAAMRSKPLISTEIGTGTSFVNEHENTGLVIPPSNAEIMSNALNFLIHHPIKASEMGNAARQRFIELFTAERMCAEYVKLYKQCLEKNNA